MTIINDSTVVVSTFLELKEALEKDNNYSLVYLDSNITLTNGISISKAKIDVVIDGTYNNTTYTLEDKKSTSASDTISIIDKNTQRVVVQNLNIIGYNYYGVIYVPENSAYKNVVVEYNNITYNGPQISFHPTGITRFIDSNITIQTSYAAGNEVAECNKIEIGGITTIDHKSTGNSSFWFRNDNPYLKILPKAKVEFTSEARELFYGVSNLEFTISKSASFSVTSHSGMSYGTYGTGTTLIDQNAHFTLKQTTSNGSYATWYSYGTITLNEGSSLEIINDYKNITKSNYNISFSSSNAGLILNEPSRVVLYNSVANVINTTASIPFQFNFNRINLFDAIVDKSQEITKDTLPTYSWYKSNDISLIKGTFTNTTTTITPQNYTEEELKNLPALTNFIFPNKKILSIGDFPISMDALTEKDTTMKGKTIPNSSVLISYNDINTVVKANDEGIFFYTYDNPLPVGTIITINAKLPDDLIYHTKTIEIVYSGELIIDNANKLIEFNYSPITTDPILCKKTEPLIITVTDSRAISSNWKLYASINHDLTSETGQILNKSLVFKDESGNITPLTENKTVIYTGSENEGTTKITTISFKEDEGILLQITSPLINNLSYESLITWTIEE